MSESLLLDTNVIHWMVSDPDHLSVNVRGVIRHNALIGSVASYWEITIKSRQMAIDNPLIWWEAAMEQLGAEVLPIRVNHVSALQGLPDHHRDPFDRILAAQAIAEGYALVTSDSVLQKYSFRSIW